MSWFLRKIRAPLEDRAPAEDEGRRRWRHRPHRRKNHLDSEPLECGSPAEMPLELDVCDANGNAVVLKDDLESEPSVAGGADRSSVGVERAHEMGDLLEKSLLLNDLIEEAFGDLEEISCAKMASRVAGDEASNQGALSRHADAPEAASLLRPEDKGPLEDDTRVGASVGEATGAPGETFGGVLSCSLSPDGAPCPVPPRGEASVHLEGAQQSSLKRTETPELSSEERSGRVSSLSEGGRPVGVPPTVPPADGGSAALPEDSEDAPVCSSPVTECAGSVLLSTEGAPRESSVAALHEEGVGAETPCDLCPGDDGGQGENGKDSPSGSSSQAGDASFALSGRDAVPCAEEPEGERCAPLMGPTAGEADSSWHPSGSCESVSSGANSDASYQIDDAPCRQDRKDVSSLVEDSFVDLSIPEGQFAGLWKDAGLSERCGTLVPPSPSGRLGSADSGDEAYDSAPDCFSEERWDSAPASPVLKDASSESVLLEEEEEDREGSALTPSRDSGACRSVEGSCLRGSGEKGPSSGESSSGGAGGSSAEGDTDGRKRPRGDSGREGSSQTHCRQSFSYDSRGEELLASSLSLDEAEARLAQRRAARAEARVLRLRELEKQQQEENEAEEERSSSHASETGGTPPRLAAPPRLSAPKGTSSSSCAANQYSRRSSSDESAHDDSASLTHPKAEVKELEEKFRKAMISNAQLDNEKATLTYEVEDLKDRFGELEESNMQLHKNYRKKCIDYEQLKKVSSQLQEENKSLCRLLQERDQLIQEYGLIIVGEEENKEAINGPTEDCVEPDSEYLSPRKILAKRVLLSQEAAELLGGGAAEGSLDVRLRKLAEDKNDLEDKVRRLQLQLEEESNQNRKMRENGIDSEKHKEATKMISEYKFRVQKAEAELSTLQANVARLDALVTRYRGQTEELEKSEEDLKVEKRKLQRELRETQNRLEEVETTNSHLQKRFDKLKNARSNLLKDLSQDPV